MSPSTTEPTPDVEAAVRQALEKGLADFSECLVAMPACDPASLSATRAGDLLQRNIARINEWNGLGYTVIDRDLYRYIVESVDLNGEGTQATVVVCLADGSKLVLAGAGPGGANVIIDDTFVSGRSAWDMRLDADGAWRAYDAPAVGDTAETDLCVGG